MVIQERKRKYILMNDAIQEIGFWKALKYYVGQWQLLVIKCLLVPPNLRRVILNIFGAQIGSQSIIHPVTFFNLYRKGFNGFVCGNHCFIGEECLLDLADSIILGDHVTLAERVTILTHINVGFKDHPLQSFFLASTSPVTIGTGSFIGTNATILPGVKIGRKAVVAAGAVVSKDVPDQTVVGGVPARVIRKLRLDELPTRQI